MQNIVRYKYPMSLIPTVRPQPFEKLHSRTFDKNLAYSYRSQDTFHNQVSSPVSKSPHWPVSALNLVILNYTHLARQYCQRMNLNIQSDHVIEASTSDILCSMRVSLETWGMISRPFFANWENGKRGNLKKTPIYSSPVRKQKLILFSSYLTKSQHEGGKKNQCSSYQ